MRTIEEAQKLLDAALADAVAHKTRADVAERALAELKAQTDKYRGDAEAAAATIAELGKLRESAKQVEDLERQLKDARGQIEASQKARADAEDPQRMASAVKARVRLLVRAQSVLGPQARIDDLGDREIMDAALRKMGHDVPKSESDVYVRARFDGAVDAYLATESALERARAAVVESDRARTSDRYDREGARQRMIERNRKGGVDATEGTR